MRLTDEMVLQDNKRFEQCNALAELKYCGWEIPHRKSIANDEIRFHAWLFRSAVELLKEQEALVPGGDSGMCEICSFYERSLPVKPRYNARTNWYECGNCHHSMTSGMHCRGELIPAYKVGFCAKCGKAVMWE